MRNSLYDSYKLSNSSTIPIYQGSAAPEMVKVVDHLQGKYDLALQGANEVGDAVMNLQYLQKDEEAAAGVRNLVTGRIDEMSTSKNWEDQVEAVRGLGRMYALRSKELAAPVAQRQEYITKELEEKDLNLTPEQKRILLARADATYTGVTKDPSGRLVGSYSGVKAAKNIDVPAKVDKWLNGIAVQMGGSELSNDNGEWKIKRGGRWEEVKGTTIVNTLNAAMASDQEYQAYKKMMGENTAFLAGRRYTSLNQIDPVLQPKVKEVMDQGYNVSQAAAMVMGKTQEDQIDQLAKTYGVTKYQKHNQWTSNETAIGDNQKARYVKSLEELPENGATVVTDILVDPNGNYETLGKTKKEASQTITNLGQSINIAKAPAIKAYEAKHGAGSYNKLPGDKQEAVLASYFNNIPGGASLYANLQNVRGEYKKAANTLASVKETEDIVDAYVLAKDYKTTKEALTSDVKTAIISSIQEQKGTVRVLENGVWKTYQAKDLATKLQTATFDKSDKTGSPILPGFLDINATSFKLKDGTKLVLQDNAVKGKVDDVVSKQGTIGKEMAAKRRQYAKEALENHSQSGAVIIMNNKKINDLMVGSIKAAEKTIYNSAGQSITGKGADDVKNLIAAGDFEFLGTNTERPSATGQDIKVKVSVRNKHDKTALPKTYYVGLKGITGQMVGERAIRESQDGKYPDLRNAGLALMPGSAFNKIRTAGLGTAATVLKLNTKTGKYEPVYKVENGHVDGMPMTTVKDINGNIQQGLVDQLEIGARLMEFENNPQYKVQYK